MPGMRETVEEPDTKQKPIIILLSSAPLTSHTQLLYMLVKLPIKLISQSDTRHRDTVRPQSQRGRERGIDRYRLTLKLTPSSEITCVTNRVFKRRPQSERMVTNGLTERKPMDYERLTTSRNIFIFNCHSRS